MAYTETLQEIQWHNTKNAREEVIDEDFKELFAEMGFHIAEITHNAEITFSPEQLNIMRKYTEQSLLYDLLFSFTITPREMQEYLQLFEPMAQGLTDCDFAKIYYGMRWNLTWQ